MFKWLKILYGIFVSDVEVCQLVEVNTNLQQVTLQIKKKAVFIKCSYLEAIGGKFLRALTPWEACLIGGYYGRTLRLSLDDQSRVKKMQRMNFLLSDKKGRYCIIFENRRGNLGYIDQKTKKEFIEHPVTIANNEAIIAQFDPSQACYIGLLAGISMEKALLADERKGTHKFEALLDRKPKLRLVQ